MGKQTPSRALVAQFEAERVRVQDALDERDALVEKVERLERVVVRMGATEEAHVLQIEQLRADRDYRMLRTLQSREAGRRSVRC